MRAVTGQEARRNVYITIRFEARVFLEREDARCLLVSTMYGSSHECKSHLPSSPSEYELERRGHGVEGQRRFSTVAVPCFGARAPMTVGVGYRGSITGTEVRDVEALW